MIKRYVSLLLLLASAGLLSCQRAIDEDSSISIVTPKTLDSLNKAGSLDAVPAGATLCYLISVTGPKIPPAVTNSCSPAFGLLSSVVKGGDTITVNVPRGSARKFELYLHLPGTDSCPEISAPLAASLLSSTYLIGSASNVDINSDNVSLTIKATFPGLSQNIAQQLNMASSCLPAAPGYQYLGLSVSSSQGKAVGTGIKMEARIGRPHSADVLTGTNLKLKVNAISQ